MSEDVGAEYARRLAAFGDEFDRSRTRSGTLMMTALIALVTLIFSAYQGIHRSDREWVALVPLGVALGVLPGMLRARRKAERASRLLSLYERGLGRLDGSGVQSGHTGEAFREAGHLYERDLDVLGADSIFGMLATTRTAVGQRALARLLLGGADASDVRARQEAVRELAPMLELRESVALLGRSAFEQLPAESFDQWLSWPDDGLAGWMRWVLVATSVAAFGLVAWGFSRGLYLSELIRNALALLAAQGAFALWLRPRVMEELEAAQRLPGQTGILRDGLKLVRAQRFRSELLQGLQKNAEGEERALRSLEGSLTLVEQRVKEWFYVPALLLGVGSHAAISLSMWKRRHGEAMRRWVTAWAEFEAILALGTYAVEHPENVYPEIVEGMARFEGAGLAHPLLREAMRNDVRLDSETRFLLISGSNMAGKSTLLRAMGCNVVLGLAGAPVCARSLRMSAMRVGASLALVDSLADGKSKFLAEVERLRDLVALAREGGCLFLIDEIFSGTNSADRRAAAEAVLRSLIAEGAVGALSTHDLALSELAEVEELHGKNVHMASPVEDDPLGFDYLLKAGVNRTTNALAIVRLLGLAE